MLYRDRWDRWAGFVDMESAGGRFLRRFLLLEPEQSRLSCYPDNPANLPPDSPPIETISLNRVSTVTGASSLRPKVPFCFVINEVMRRWIIQADDDEDLANWIKILNEAIKITVPKDLKLCSEVPEGPHRTEIIAGVVVHLPVGLESSALTEAPPLIVPIAAPTRVPLIIRTGYCVKQGGVMKNWKRRYFVLDDTSLCYYRNDLDTDPLRTIHLRDVRTVRAASDQLVEQMMRDNLCEMVTPYRTFYIQADSPHEMTQWVDNITAAARVWSPPPHPPPHHHPPPLPPPAAAEEESR